MKSYSRKSVCIFYILMLIFNYSVEIFAVQSDNIIIFTPKSQIDAIKVFGATSKITQCNPGMSDINTVNSNKIASYINSTRMAFCGNSKNTDIKIWVKYDANAKVFGVIGAGMENGIEVTYHCK